MTQEQPLRQDEATRNYEAPRVEVVLTPDDLEREVQYAGRPSQPPT